MKEDHYILLLQKQLSAGGLSEAEHAALNAWLAESSGNERVARQVRKAWELSEGFRQEPDLDLDADFARLEKRLVAEAPATKIVAMNPQRRWLRVAAALLLLAIAPFLVKKYLQPAARYEVATAGKSPRKEPVLLPDGSKIWLNSATECSYSLTATGKERRVKLNGEAFFEVARDERKPFVVETASGEVTVLGTSFSVKERAGGNTLEVQVVSGKVRLQPTGARENLVLTANEQGVFNKTDNRLLKTNPDHQNDLAWHTRRLVFRNKILADAVQEISLLFHVKIEIADAGVKKCPLTATFDDKSLEVVLNTIGQVLGTTAVKNSDGSYVLKGGRCE
jgi:ferric-dicitrate binding protein FerR (iron transport regulator)